MINASLHIPTPAFLSFEWKKNITLRLFFLQYLFYLEMPFCLWWHFPFSLPFKWVTSNLSNLNWTIGSFQVLHNTRHREKIIQVWQDVSGELHLHVGRLVCIFKKKYVCPILVGLNIFGLWCHNNHTSYFFLRPFSLIFVSLQVSMSFRKYSLFSLLKKFYPMSSQRILLFLYRKVRIHNWYDTVVRIHCQLSFISKTKPYSLTAQNTNPPKKKTRYKGPLLLKLYRSIEWFLFCIISSLSFLYC